MTQGAALQDIILIRINSHVDLEPAGVLYQ